MSKHSKHGHAGAQQPHGPETPRQRGLREFHQKRYAAAIVAWEKIAETDELLKKALAEAHFRLSVESKDASISTQHLTQAVELAPGDAIYAYHLGLAFHREGRPDAALEHYKRAVANGLADRTAGITIAVAALEVDPKASLQELPGVTDADRQALAPLLPLLRKQAVEPSAADALRRHLSGATGLLPIGRKLSLACETALQMLNELAMLSSGNAAGASQAFASVKVVPTELQGIHWNYAGVAAFVAHNMPQSEHAWRESYHANPYGQAGWNQGALAMQRTQERLQAGDRAGALRLVGESAHLASAPPAFSVLALTELSRAAREAAVAGDWAAARDHWSTAQTVLSHFDPKTAFGKTASARPILRNLALAYEANGQWQEAAETWRALVRAKPRKGVAAGYGDEHWAWVRKRVVACYKQAGDLAGGIAMLRQALKASPEDAEVRLDLAQALWSNEQLQAAENELNRLLEKQPRHVEGLRTLSELQLDRGEYFVAQQTMRQALEIEPNNADLRRRMAHVLVTAGAYANDAGNYAAAGNYFVEAATFAPDDYNIPINQARAAFNQRKMSQAKEYLEHALQLGKDNPDAYGQAAVCWLFERKLDEARGIIARAEAAGQASAEMYLTTGMEAVMQAAPPQDELSALSYMIGLTASSIRPPSKPSKEQEAAARWGHELLERAVNAAAGAAPGPATNGDMLRFIVAAFIARGLAGGAGYGRRLVELTPDDRHAWYSLGILLGYDREVKEAQNALKKAADLARKQGDKGFASEANTLRRIVSEPTFPTLMRMSMQAAQSGMVDDEYWDEEF
jgi:tetratricopeptide (TPR) repeat protein